MKTFIILTLVALTAANWKLKSSKDWEEIQNDCDKRIKVSKELLENTKNDKYPPGEVFERVLCYFRGLEIWNETDGFLEDRIMIGMENDAKRISNYNEHLLREGLTGCSDKNAEGSAPFDWAYRWFKCFIDNKYLFDSLTRTNFHTRRKANE